MQLNVRIEPIDHLRLSDDALKMVLNGTTLRLADPTFLVSEHELKSDYMIKIWKFSESYRQKHSFKAWKND